MIMKDYYRQDLIDQINQLPDAVFSAHGLTKAALAAKGSDNLDLLWALYQKSVEEYDVDPDYAAKDALYEAFDIPIEEWAENEGGK